MQTVDVVHHGSIVEIIFNRPEALNALSTAMADELVTVCAEVSRHEDARVVLVSAAGERAFCVGADLKERRTMSDEHLARQRVVFRAAFAGVLTLPQPTIAAVHGYALGGGCEFALSCDLIVADETAIFGFPETSVGLVPGGGGTQLATRRLGPARAADLIFTGRHIRVAEAEKIGLIDRRASQGHARAAALSLAQQIAGNSPVALRAAKSAMRQGLGAPLDQGLDIEDVAWRTAAFSADRREGIAAFNEKRTPQWVGR